MHVHVKGYITLRALLGERQVEYTLGEQATLRLLMERLAAELGGDFRVQVSQLLGGASRPSLAVLLNGSHVNHLACRWETCLQDGDQVAIFPPVAGG